MTRRTLILFAAAGSAALLLGALAFQYWGGLAPCKMCIWQRWPHGAAIALGLIGFAAPLAIVAVLGALAAFTTGAIGVYHAGVEQGWWEGPTTCTSGDISALSPSELMNQIMTAPLIRCDEIAWSFAGLSMAGWNAVISFGLMAIWLIALRQPNSK